MAGESYVQVAADGTGKFVRTIEVTLTEPDGTQKTVEQQVVTVADGTWGTGALQEVTREREAMVFDDDVATVLMEIREILDDVREYLYAMSSFGSPHTLNDEMFASGVGVQAQPDELIDDEA